MRTSQQDEMLKKLPELLRKYSLNNAVGYSDGQKFFNKYIIPSYLTNENRHQLEFYNKTKYGKGVYQELSGVGPVFKVKGEDTLLHVAFGLRLTYEEAFMLFWYSGKTLLIDDPVMGTINSILLELDIIRIDKHIENPVAELERLIGENNLHLR